MVLLSVCSFIWIILAHISTKSRKTVHFDLKFLPIKVI